MPDLVIFDCDGVLVDSEPISCRVHAELLTAAGFPLTAADILARYVGQSARAIFASLEREHGRAVPADIGGRIEAAVLAAFASAPLRAIPDAAETLARLGVPFALASSSRPARIDRALALTGLDRHFAPDRRFSAVMVERGKPAPDLFLLAARTLGAAPERTVVLEDAEAGVRAALAAGMQAIGFVGGGHCGPGHGERLLSLGALGVIERLRDLPDLLGEGRLTRSRGAGEPSRD